MNLTRRTIIFILLIVGIIAIFIYFLPHIHRKNSIKVGILHSLTGPMALSEKPVVDAALLAIDEINNHGGINGRLIKPIIKDGKSDENIFAHKAEELIRDDHVAVIFGCWTSACRKRVKDVVEKYNKILMYPVQYEGLEQSPNIFYTGAVPNQQIIPGVTWAFYNLGKSFFLIGSDYIFPHMANEIIKAHVAALGGTIVGEEYIALDEQNIASVVEKIVAVKPQVILNTINGDANILFFKGLRDHGIMPHNVPTMSFSIAEPDLKYLDLSTMVGDYATWNYFQSLFRVENLKFVENFKKKFGKTRVLNNNMETSYDNVYLWAQAVAQAGSTSTQPVIKALKKQIFSAPSGIIYLDTQTQQAWRSIFIGKILYNGQFDIVWSSKKAVRPMTYPPYYDKGYWDTKIEDLYKQWGNQWTKKN